MLVLSVWQIVASSKIFKFSLNLLFLSLVGHSVIKIDAEVIKMVIKKHIVLYFEGSLLADVWETGGTSPRIHDLGIK
jgi:hypothetical protein